MSFQTVSNNQKIFDKDMYISSLISNLNAPLKRIKIQYSPFFKTHPNRKAALLQNSRTVIDDERKIAYNRIPKAANSTIVATMFQIDSLKHTKININQFKKKGKKLSKLKYGEIEEINRYYFIFTFVRNPYTRIISCYHDKIKNRKITNDRHVIKMNNLFDEYVSFDEFLTYIKYGNNLYIDAHWAPQVSLLSFPFSRYDLIGSVENLREDFMPVAKYLGLNSSIRNYAPHATGAAAKISNMTKQQARAVREIYADDFANFGYDLDPSNANVKPTPTSVRNSPKGTLY